MDTQDEDDLDLNIDMTEVKRVLEAGNLYEPNMPRKDMIAYYKVLKNSESTASEEDESRRFNESQNELKELLDDDSTMEIVEKTSRLSKEKPFFPKSWTSDKKNNSIDSALEKSINENTVEETETESFKDATKTVFGFNEMADDTENSLLIITHELKYVPIHCSKKFLNADTILRAKMLYVYHTRVNKKKTERARLSFYPAPLPKVTSTSETFPSFTEIDNPETYISRAGRQTKRKIYKDDFEEETFDDVVIKKVKSFDKSDWKSKPAAKSTVRSQKKQEREKVTENSNSELEITEKEKKVYPKREPLSKRMSNTEIIKRSSLFTPKKRWEKMFDQISEDEESKEKKEKAMEMFNKTLDELDDENSETTTSEEIVTIQDEDFVRRRIIPTIPNRKLTRKRSNAEGVLPLDIKINSPSQKKSTSIAEPSSSSQEKEDAVARTTVRRRPPIRKTPVTIDVINSLPSTSGTSTTTNKVTCPICDCTFEENKIEGHAATCGDEPAPATSQPKIQRITCEVCDKVVEFDTNYEVHVKECIKKNKDKN